MCRRRLVPTVCGDLGHVAALSALPLCRLDQGKVAISLIDAVGLTVPGLIIVSGLFVLPRFLTTDSLLFFSVSSIRASLLPRFSCFLLSFLLSGEVLYRWRLRRVCHAHRRIRKGASWRDVICLGSSALHT